MTELLVGLVLGSRYSCRLELSLTVVLAFFNLEVSLLSSGLKLYILRGTTGSMSRLLSVAFLVLRVLYLEWFV